MKKLFFIASFFMLLGMTACSSKDRDVLAVEQLTHRLIPQYADRFVFEIVPDEDRITIRWKVRTEKSTLAGITLIRWLPD